MQEGKKKEREREEKHSLGRGRKVQMPAIQMSVGRVGVVKEV